MMCETRMSKRISFVCQIILRMSKKPLVPWVISHFNGKILAAHCDFMARLDGSCSYVESLLWLLEQVLKEETP